MKIEPKPQEVIQAQLAAFAAESKESPESAHVARHLGELSTDNAVVPGEDYVSFLRQVGGSKYDSIEGRADMLRGYQLFAPQVHDLIDELKGKDVEQKKEHPMHLASGSGVEVFKITQQDKDYVVRLDKFSNTTATSGMDSYVGGSVLAKGMKHVEQVVGVSYEDGAVVSEVMPGKELGEVSAEDAMGITQRQVDEFLDTVIEAGNRGIVLDMKWRNVFYDPDEGFGLVDVSSAREDRRVDTTPGAYVGGMFATALVVARNDESDLARQSVQDKYISAVKNKLEGADLEKAMATIEKNLLLHKQLEELSAARRQTHDSASNQDDSKDEDLV